MRKALLKFAATLCVLACLGCGGEPVQSKEAIQTEREKLPQPITPAGAEAMVSEDSPFRERWKLNLGAGGEVAHIWFPPAELEYNYIVVMTKKHELLAIRRRSGMAEWSTMLSAPVTGEPFFTPYAIYFVVHSYIYALERHSGEPIWRALLDFPPASGPVVHEEERKMPIVYVPGLDRKVYALEIDMEVWPPRTGVAGIHRTDFQYRKPIARIIWRYPGLGTIAGGLGFARRKVYVSDDKNRTYAIDTSRLILGKPSQVHSHLAQGPMVCKPTMIGPYCFVSSLDHNLYCLDQRDLGKLWRYPSGYRLRTPAYALVDPFTNKTQVIIKSGAKGPLVGLRDTNGKKLWSLPKGNRVIARFAEPENVLEKRTVMVVMNDDNTVSGHYASNGEEAWSTSLKGYKLFPINTTFPFVFTTQGENTLVALEYAK